MNEYAELFKPARISGVMVKNRVVMAPMQTNFALASGEVSKKLIDYYEARARGGVGLIVVEAAYVHISGRDSFGQLSIDSPQWTAGLERLSQAVKAYGTRIFLQLFHAGRQTSCKATGMQPIAPSPIPCSIIGEKPRELSVEEIEALEDCFVNAAARAVMAGFDGLELHAAHGYLINQFLSPHSNCRSDQYGGSLKNRTRFLINIVRRIKKLQPGFLLSVRLNMDDFIPGGLSLNESVLIAQSLEQEGVDVIHCSSGTYESGLNSIEPASYKEGWRVYLAGELKKWIKIPVISGGVINNPGSARQLLEAKQADFVFLGRTLLADPQWVNKVKEGRTRDIRPCLMCNRCIERNFKGLAVCCTVNYWVGREGEFELYSGRRASGKAVIIGAGPAGLQAALALKRLGLEVQVFEKESRAGGLLNLAGKPPHKHRLTRFCEYLLREVDKQNIPIVFNHPFSEADLARENPDYVIVATGSEPRKPGIPGQDGPNCLTVEEVLGEKVNIQNKQVVVVGGGSNGCETADFLIERGNRVVIVEQAQFLAPAMEKKNRRDMLNRMDKEGLVKRLGSQVLAVEGAGVKIENEQGIEELNADYVVWATGYSPRQDLYMRIKELHPRTFIIGDAFQVGGIRDAAAQAETLAKSILSMQ